MDVGIRCSSRLPCPALPSLSSAVPSSIATHTILYTTTHMHVDPRQSHGFASENEICSGVLIPGDFQTHRLGMTLVSMHCHKLLGPKPGPLPPSQLAAFDHLLRLDNSTTMGKSQSKLSPEQLSDLQKNTYCMSCAVSSRRELIDLTTSR